MQQRGKKSQKNAINTSKREKKNRKLFKKRKLDKGKSTMLNFLFEKNRKRRKGSTKNNARCKQLETT